MNLYLKKRIFTDEKKSIFQLKSEWFSLYYAFKQKQNNKKKKYERTQNATDADIYFCKWLQNKLNMWTLYNCNPKKAGEYLVCKFAKHFLAISSACNEMDREKITREV